MTSAPNKGSPRLPAAAEDPATIDFGALAGEMSSSQMGWGSLVSFLAVAVVGVMAIVGVAQVVSRPLSIPAEFSTPVADSKISRLENLLASGSDVDVVFLGSTGADRAFDAGEIAEQMGDDRVGFNAGYPDASVEVVRRWTFDEILPRTGPTHVVLGLTPSDLRSGTSSSVDDSLDRYNTARATRRGGAAVLERSIAERVSLVRYRELWTETGSWETMLTNPGSSPSALTHRRDVFGSVFELEPTRSPVRVVEATESIDLLDEWNRLVADIEAAGSTVTLMYLPVPPSTERIVEGPISADVAVPPLRSELERFGAQFVVPDASDLTAADFVDELHMSLDGARKLAPEIASLLSGAE